MITKHPWFGPKKTFGWGWTPVTWEGWFVTAICASIVIGAFLAFGYSAAAIYLTIGAVGALVAICLLTGTAPG
jgi:hypothetical protein